MYRQQFQHHPIFGHIFFPGLKTRVTHESGGYLVRTNELGFRSEREVTPKKAPGTFRIVVFGDSFTAGDAVSNKQRYTDILETMLPDVEVLNFGLPGTGTDQQLLIFREMTKDLEFDLVVLGMQVENIRRIASRYRPRMTAEGDTLLVAKPYFTLEADGSLTSHPPPLDGPVNPEDLPEDQWKYVDQGGSLPGLRRFVKKLGQPLKQTLQKLSHYQPVPAYDDPQNPDWLLMKAILKHMIDECPTDLIIYTFPLYHFVEETSDPGGYRSRFAELHDPPHARVFDPLEKLLTFSKEERRAFRFKKDAHPTAAYHKVLAEMLAEEVRPLLPANVV